MRGSESGLPDHPSEVDLLVGPPGASASVAAGLFNPASWSVQPSGGLFLGWTDPNGDRPGGNYTGVLSLRRLALGFRRFHTPDGRTRFREYTLGLSAGDRSSGWGLAYSWAKAKTTATFESTRVPAAVRHERLSWGHVRRFRPASIGLVGVWDLERRDSYLQADLGVRPLGPRVTIWGDAVLERRQSFEDIQSSYGLEVLLVPGLALGARARSTGEISLRLDVRLDRSLQGSWRPHLDENGERRSATYAVEIGRGGAPLGYGVLGRGRGSAEMHLEGPIVYRRYEYFDERTTLLDVLARIHAVAEDPRVGGLALNLSGVHAGAEMLWEVREQLMGLRARGKKVVLYVDRARMFHYMLATCADEIWIDPEGALEILGISLGRTYMRRALDKLGLGVEEWRYFKYKSAFEGFARDSMSEPDQEQRQELADEIYEIIAQVVTTERPITRDAWDALVDTKGVLMPQEAQDAGLVDSIGTFEQAKASARHADRNREPDPSRSLASFFGDPVWGPEAWGEPPRIALLYAIGECALDRGIRARALAREFRRVRNDPRVRAVVLRADSPGGDVLASDLVAREVRETAKQKPVIVSQGALAASGGYWISMYGTRIVASPLTITGSIGVISGWIWDREFGDKIGFTYDQVQRGRHADWGGGIRLPFLNAVVPNRQAKPEERERGEEWIRHLYQDFVTQVATGRALGIEDVEAIAQGRVWSGARALELGLVDESGGLWRSLEIAKAAAGIPPSRSVRIEQGPRIGLLNMGALRRRFGGIREEPAADAGWGSGPEREFLRLLAGARGRPLLLTDPIRLNDEGSFSLEP